MSFPEELQELFEILRKNREQLPDKLIGPSEQRVCRQDLAGPEAAEDDGLTQMCGGYTIDELHNALRQEHDNPGSTPLKDVMKLYE